MILRVPWCMVGWLWFVGTIVPVIGFVRIGYTTVADRYTYLPSIGPFMIVAWAAEKLIGKRI